ncbi:heme biosynthesis protein HemY [Actibacterium mucosum KCTC 23349]|uniref:Heme biosynthesis protein HemY n=1 Tax=Actibacterium mucosum KCTC 23349 TaxID=1454373 RepID=A0A037ZM74_9RHOB|nr:heme biosynthesis HemY N-terminal domain-containing protein [Actibacterium mucosum]KAJ57204.1 heme biosynthesis protein HemY [Actibacterium mucosum KCTC 23349]
MLWTLAKILIFVALVAVIAMGAGFLMEAKEGLRIVVAGWEVTLGPMQAIIAGLLALAAVWLLLRLAGLLAALLAALPKFVAGDDTALNRLIHGNRNREQRGFKALADGMIALASGDGREAIVKAARAERLLRRPELTNLLIAQAAEISGDRTKALETYKRLLADDRTRFVGVRGIMKQKLSDGDTETALKLAEKAFALKPAHAETQDVLLKLQAGNADWKAARKTLDAKLRHGHLPRDVHKRRNAVLALSEARDVLAEGESIEARETAIEANRLSPDLIPAAVMAARGYIENGKPRYATRLVKKAWEVQPHPDLAAAFAEIVPDETPEQRLVRFKPLTAQHEGHPETRMLLAELYVAAEDFPAARKALGDLAETDPTSRVLALMAAVERGQGAEDRVVRAWLTAAVTAPRGPQWVCDNCGAVHGAWAPVCSTCDSFDTLTWKTPPESNIALPQSAQMLPLIVGEPPASDLAEIEEADAEPVDAEPVEADADEVGPSDEQVPIILDAEPADKNSRPH